MEKNGKSGKSKYFHERNIKITFRNVTPVGENEDSNMSSSEQPQVNVLNPTSGGGSNGIPPTTSDTKQM